MRAAYARRVFSYQAWPANTRFDVFRFIVIEVVAAFLPFSYDRRYFEFVVRSQRIETMVRTLVSVAERDRPRYKSETGGKYVLPEPRDGMAPLTYRARAALVVVTSVPASQRDNRKRQLIAGVNATR
jgi:hypothetical protein